MSIANNDESLNLAAVKERFTDSAKTLGEVETQLQGLLAQQQSRESAVDGLEKASAELQALMGSLISTSALLAGVSSTAGAAFESIKAAADSVTREDILGTIASLERKVDEQSAKIERLETERDAALAQMRDVGLKLELLKATASSRSLKKAGLEPE